MTKFVKKPAFLAPFARLFTRGESDVYDSIPFQNAESCGDETVPALTAPATWSAEAAEVLAHAACADIPADLYAIEENTVPSWLWRHRARGSRRAAEGDARQIVDRAVASAAAKAWKLNLFSAEKYARAFYDEARFALMQRHIAIEPELMRIWGLGFAYGLPEDGKAPAHAPTTPSVGLSNAAIETLLGKNKTAPATAWKKLFAIKPRDNQPVTVALRLSDIAADWHSPEAVPARAVIDVMALRHNDGSVNIDMVRQAARVLTILFDLHECQAAVGLANLAPLLLALGLAYDSDAGRALAASVAALVTAECYAASAEMAALRGANAGFTAARDAIMRALRNHRRAAYGDAADYEKLSVLPAPLALKNCPDLALAAAAQQRWDDVVERARVFGLRATQVTDLTPSPTLAVVMQSASQGLEPMRSLTILRSDASNDTHRAELNPAAGEAMTRLGYARSATAMVAQHIVGAQTLTGAPVINARSLRLRGIDDAAFRKIDSCLRGVDSLRLAVTPWVIGVDYCRTRLKIPARVMESPRFDLLKQLGFDDADIAAASLYCYGHGTARNCKTLHLRHRSLFARGAEVNIEARLRMAAAVQGFISGDTGIVATVPVTDSVKHGTDMAVSAWRRGLKALTVVFDPDLAAPAPRPAHPAARRIKPAPHPHAKPIGTTNRTAQQSKTPPVSIARKQIVRRVRATDYGQSS